ncbi:RNA-binding protein 4B isoform X2 [Ciconia boyciana]|uniref:RNA-binding protein 4B isoform X2 n=1 Tax=Ciconia boyciana TaxID=52775 RepID=UPI003BA03A1C
MVKLFIGNLPREATEQEIRSLFEQYGKVLECDIIKNYGFVHIEDKTAAEDAIRNLHHHKLHGVCINVEASKNKSKASTKLHVGNISPACTNLELRAKFEEYGPVIECDIVKDYAFVHMERAEDAVEAIRGLDNTEFQGKIFAAGRRVPVAHRIGTARLGLRRASKHSRVQLTSRFLMDAQLLPSLVRSSSTPPQLSVLSCQDLLFR